jgi:DNA-binding response OmpR family regulator
VSPAHLVLAEDDRNDTFFLLRAFEKAGFAKPARTMGDGEDVVRYLSGAGPYADRREHPLASHLLLDLKLPRVSGMQILEWIRKSSPVPELPIIILTSSDRAEDRARVQSLIVDGYFVKPSRHAELGTMVKAIAGLWKF